MKIIMHNHYHNLLYKLSTILLYHYTMYRIYIIIGKLPKIWAGRKNA